MKLKLPYKNLLGYLGLIAIIGSGASAATSMHMPNRSGSQKASFTLVSATLKTLTQTSVAAADGTAAGNGL